MKNKFFIIFVFSLPLVMLSGCSDFRKAVGKEKVIPDEFSIALTPSLLIPPGYKIDPETMKNEDSIKDEEDFRLIDKIVVKDKNIFFLRFNKKSLKRFRIRWDQECVSNISWIQQVEHNICM